MQTAWRKIQEAVRRRIGRDRSDAEESARRADEDAARAENEGYPLGRGSGGDDGNPLAGRTRLTTPTPTPRAPQRTGTAEQPCPEPSASGWRPSSGGSATAAGSCKATGERYHVGTLERRKCIRSQSATDADPGSRAASPAMSAEDFCREVAWQSRDQHGQDPCQKHLPQARRVRTRGRRGPRRRLGLL